MIHGWAGIRSGARSAARIAVGLAAAPLLALGLLQCGEEPTSSLPGSLQLALKGTQTELCDSIEIEVLASGRVAARAVVVPESDGSFRTVLALPSGQAYRVRAFAWGEGVEPWPDGARDRGVLGAGLSNEVTVPPGRTVEARLDLESAEARVQAVDGSPGVPEIQARWRPVSQATSYRLVWYPLREGTPAAGEAVADTIVTQPWSRVSLPGECDSVLFRVRPRYGEREGVAVGGVWRDLARWLDLPRMTAVRPAPGATVAADSLLVEVVFDRAVDPASLEEGLSWRRADDLAPVAFSILCFEENRRVRLEPAAGAVLMGTSYRVGVTPAVRDLEARPFDADGTRPGLQDTSFVWATAPYDPLRVTAMQPESGEEEVARDAVIVLTFNRPVLADSLTSRAIAVTDSWGATLAGDLERLADGATVSWTPGEPAWYATACTVRVTSRLVDLAGRPFDQDPATYPEIEPFAGVFITVEQPLGPRVEAVVPEPGARAVPRTTPVSVTFSEPIDPQSVRPTSSLRLLRGDGVGVPGTIAAGGDGAEFTFTPSAPLDAGQTYEIVARGELPGGGPGIVDLAGVPLDQDRAARGYQPFSSSFRVELALSVQASFDPAGPDTFVARDAAALLVFSREVEPATVTAASVGLRRENGTPVAAALTLDPDLRHARLAPASLLDPLARYCLRVDTLAAAADGSLLDMDAALPGHQPYTRFFTAEPESIHPRVTAVRPAHGAAAVSPGDSARVDFSLPVDPATIGPASFTVAPAAGGDPVAGTILSGRLAALWRPAAPLAFETEYEIRVTSAVRDATGLFALDQDPAQSGLQDFTARFTTDRERVRPRVEAVDPADGVEAVPLGARVRLRFSEPVDAASVAGAFALGSALGPVAGSGAPEENGEAWTFTPDRALAWNSEYLVTLDTTAVDLRGNFLDQLPGTPGAQGFSSSFRTESDAVSPRVLWNTPEDEAGDVAVDITVRLGFSEPLLRASVVPGALRVSREALDVPGRCALEAGDTVVAWIPVTLPDSLATVLAEGARYTVTADTLLRDVWGNGLDQDAGLSGRQAHRFHFTTVPEHVPPRVLGHLPETDTVSVAGPLAIVFSEAMSEASLLAPDAVRLARLDGPEVPTSLALSPGGDTLGISFNELLEFARSYSLTVDTLATDRAGNALDQDPSAPGAQAWEIVLESAPDRVQPAVTGVAPPDGAVQVVVETAVEIAFSEALDPASVSGETVSLSGPGGRVALAGDGEPALDFARTRVTLVPAAPLAESTAYTIAAEGVLDAAGNPLASAFQAVFTTGGGPVIDWAGGLCPSGDSARVLLDASSSTDPQGDPIVWALWEWGDGARDSLAAPAGLIAEHEYVCQDTAGCDGLDNDDDGTADEGEGPGGCDESYRVTLTLADDRGFVARASGGVSFCAFLVRACAPAAGDTVAAGDTLRARLTRPVDPTLQTGPTLTRMADEMEIFCEVLLRDAGVTLLLVPAEPFTAGLYRLTLTPDFLDAAGGRLDQEPCVEGEQRFEVLFFGPE